MYCCPKIILIWLHLLFLFYFLLKCLMMKQDGRVICSSTPTYGEGTEAGNEAGYIVGMSTCYPQPGSVRISDGEILSLVSNYSSAQRHIGVMGLFYLLVADPSHKSNPLLHNAVRVRFYTLSRLCQIPDFRSSILNISFDFSRCNGKHWSAPPIGLKG